MFDEREIASRIASAAADEMQLPRSVANDVAFHMTDWLGDLEALVRFYRDPGALSSAKAAEILTSFLVHAPNHIAAAAKLFTGFPVADVFQVGALGDDDLSCPE
jgi:hypothetical protein